MGHLQAEGDLELGQLEAAHGDSVLQVREIVHDGLWGEAGFHGVQAIALVGEQHVHGEGARGGLGELVRQAERFERRVG